MNEKLIAVRHAIIGGVSRAGARAPAQAARGACARQVRWGPPWRARSRATCIRATKPRTNPKVSLDLDSSVNRTT
eukprot:2956576-Pyramimonas_sp.AAC.1